MSDSDYKVGVTFIWTIENLDRCFEANLVSPIFVSRSLNDTEWQIHMYPIGKDEDYISLILKRCGSDDKGIDRIIVDCELSIVGEDGSSLTCMEVKNRGFVRGHSWKCKKFVLEEDVFENEKSEYLPSDSLTVRCRMWRRANENTQAEFICLNTKIEQISFVWAIKDFSSLKPYQRKKIHVKKTYSENPILTYELFFEAGNEDAIIEITAVECPIFELSCSISILNCLGEEFLFENASHSFKLTMSNWNPIKQKLFPEVLQFPSLITKSALVSNKNLYLPMDVLSLRVRCFFWTGYTNDIDIKHIPIQNYQVSESSELLLPTCEKETCNEMTDCNYEKYVHDMQCMYEERFLSDFNLRVGNKTFPVHKNILSARSPVFRAMFTTPMKEKEGDGINVPDIDEDTLQRMLVFVYSNKIEDLEWQSAIDLYFAADKYAIEGLKSTTCSILKSRLSVLNVCEVLVHAELHEDQDLKSTAMKFIVNHDKEIIGTEDWKKFQKKHLHLTVEILSILYTKLRN